MAVKADLSTTQVCLSLQTEEMFLVDRSDDNAEAKKLPHSMKVPDQEELGDFNDWKGSFRASISHNSRGKRGRRKNLYQNPLTSL